MTIAHRPPSVIALLCAGLIVGLLVTSCDESKPTTVCQLVLDETRSRSEALQTSDPLPPAQFEFEQVVQVYEATGCESRNADVDEVSLVVRNLTSCMQEINFFISFLYLSDFNQIFSTVPFAASMASTADLENA